MSASGDESPVRRTSSSAARMRQSTSPTRRSAPPRGLPTTGGRDGSPVGRREGRGGGPAAGSSPALDAAGAERREAARERMRARAAARRALRGEDEFPASPGGPPSALNRTTRSATSLALMKSRRERLKKGATVDQEQVGTSRRSVDGDGFEADGGFFAEDDDGFEATGDAYSTARRGPVDAQDLIENLDAETSLLASTRAARPFQLASVFGTDLDYDGEARTAAERRGEYDGEMMRRVVHTWEGGVPQSRILARLWRTSVSPHRTIHATNVPDGDDDSEYELSDDGLGRHWLLRWLPGRWVFQPRKKKEKRTEEDSPLRRTTEGHPPPSHLLTSNDVGLYKPLAPPRARVLLELGPSRVSDRLLYEAAHETTFEEAVGEDPVEEQEATTPNPLVSSAESSFRAEKVAKLREAYMVEGALRVGANPLEYFHQRPPNIDAAAFRNDVKVAARRDDVPRDDGAAGGTVSSAFSTAVLVVHLSRLALYDHPLFCAEDRLYAELRLLYGEYRRYLEAQTSRYLRQRLQRLLDAARDLEQDLAEMATKKKQKPPAAAAAAATTTTTAATTEDLTSSSRRAHLVAEARTVAAEVFETVSLLAAEEDSVHELSEALYTTWNQMKGLRRHQGFVSTPAKLVAINVHLASADQDKTPKLEAQVAVLEALIPFLAAHGGGTTTAASKTPKEEEDHQEVARVAAFVRAFARDTVALSSKKESFVLKLHTTVELTRDDDKAVPIHEVMRRRRVRQQRIYVVVRANGHRVAATAAAALEWPHFTAQVDRDLRLRVARRPVQLEVELWQKRLFFDLRLATALVPVPGMSSRHDNATAHSLAPVADWFHFASPTVHWNVPFAAGDDVEVFVGGGKEEKKKNKAEGRWERGSVTRVNWSTYDVRTLRGAVVRGVPPARLRRGGGAVFEVHQRHLTGATLVSVHWATKQTPASAPNWDARLNARGGGSSDGPEAASKNPLHAPTSSSSSQGVDAPNKRPPGYAELASVPPRPQNDDARRFSRGGTGTSENRMIPAGATDRYFFAADGSAQKARYDVFNALGNRVGFPARFDPNDPRNASLLERIRRLTSSGSSGGDSSNTSNSGRFRAVELRRRVAFRFRGARGGGALGGVAFDDHTGTAIPTRHRALLLRRNQPTLFSAGIPATDAATLVDGRIVDLVARHGGLAPHERLDDGLLSDKRGGGDDTAASYGGGGNEDDDDEEDDDDDLVSGKNRKTRRVKDFVQRIQDATSERGRFERGAALPVAAVINEGTPIPKLRVRGVVDGTMTALTQRRRALRPPRKRRNATASAASDCSLLVQVISATHVPRATRRRPNPPPAAAADAQSASASSSGFLESIDAVNIARAKQQRESGTFVVASFQEHRRRTMLAAGTAPRWKETLELPFIAPLGDYSPTALLGCGDCLRVAVFSEVTEDLEPRAGAATEDTEPVVRRVFVGDISIPFTTLYCSGGTEGYVDGTFRLRTPPVYTGAEHHHHHHGRSAAAASSLDLDGAPRTMINDDDLGGGGGDYAGTTMVSAAEAGPKLLKRGSKVSYIHLAIFLRPPLAAPTQSPSYHSTFEDEALMRYASFWVDQLRLFLETTEDRLGRPVDGRVAKRVVEVFGTSTRGDSILACRYLRPLEPPPGVDTPGKAARFVSLIPFLDDWQSFGAASLDVWCTCHEFLDIGAGDWEEHAILLHNYIWWLLVEAKQASPDDLYLVVGSGMPEGNTVYVMQKTSTSSRAESVIFWNACTGDVCSAADPKLALVDLGVVIAPDNMWANLQEVCSPAKLLYDFANPAHWRPFFADVERSKRGCQCVCWPGPLAYTKPPVLATVQPHALTYTAPDVVAAEKIQTALADELKRRVRRWRSRRADRYAHTSFSVDFSRRLQNLLPHLETLHANSKLTPAAIERHKRDALGVGHAWDVDAVALHFPFTDVDTILQRLRATNIHETKLKDAQFVIGVYVHPLVNRLFSVWVYYGVINPRRSNR